MDIIEPSCTAAQNTLDEISCSGLTTAAVQTMMNDAFSGIEGICPDLHACGATIGGKS